MYGYQIKHSVAVSSYVFYLTRKRFQDCHIIKPPEAVSSSVSSEAYYDVNPPPPPTPFNLFESAAQFKHFYEVGNCLAGRSVS